MRQHLLTLSSCALMFFMLISCGGDKKKKDDFSSPRNLYVDYVTSFTGGVVSRTAPIKLRLAKDAGDSLAGKTIESKVFSFSPSLDGETFWEDNRTVVFKPNEMLKSGEEFKATANLKKLIPNVASDKSEFKFTFQTLIQNFDIELKGLQVYEKNNLEKVKLQGLFQMADFAPLDDIKKVITASQNGNALEVNWSTANSDNVYNFIIENVVRGEDEGEVELELNGEPIGVDKKDSETFKVPALSDFKVLNARLVKGVESYISVQFTDPLDDKQNLTGMVQIGSNSAAPRVVVNLNELKVYPTETLTGSTSVTIHAGVKNVAGFKLKEKFSTDIQIEQRKPEVKLAIEQDKSLLPNSKGLVLPFEAVGLASVEVTVVRVFEKNVLQYLQVNRLGGQNQLSRVGRPVMRKTIALNNMGVTNLNEWNRFVLNLEDIIKVEPGAVYQIIIGFKKQHSLYFCSEDEQDSYEEEEELVDDSWGPQDDYYYDDYDYYYDDYDWEERDNPCSNSYYGCRRNVKKIVFASDLGIIAKKRDNGPVDVFVTNIINTKTISGASIEIYDYQQQLIGSGSTDGDGKVTIDVKGRPFVLVAKSGEQFGYLRLDDGSSLSLSSFDVSGVEVQNGIKGFIYGERGVWRPADTVHLAFILEDSQDELPDQHPVVLELRDPQGQLHTRKVSSQSVGDIYRFDLVTDSEAPTGNWLAKVKVGGASFTKTVKIETIKPNRLKIDLDFGKDKLTALDENIGGNLNVRWLSGAKANGLKAEFEMMLTPVKTTFDNYNNYSFDDPSKEFYSDREMVYEGRVNAEGYARMNIRLGEVDNAPGALMAKFYGKVYEEGGDFSIKNVSIPYYPYSSFVGVNAPDGDKRGILVTDKDHTVSIVTLSADGKPVDRKNVQVELYKIDWRWWWDNSYDNLSNYIGRSYNKPEQQATINTSNGKGMWKLRVNQPEWGRYYIKVTDPVSDHSAGQVVFIDWPGWAGKGNRGDLAGASMLDFGIEKDDYKVGEQIKLSIPSTKGNKILVSLETGSEIVQTFWVNADDESTTVSFEATAAMAPNLYAHLTMIQPHAQDANDLPIRMYGVQSIKVTDPGTRLEPVITMPAELRPEQTFTIEVKEASKKPMAYTVAVVDEGLLDITNFKTPDPWSAFYAREALGIKTWDVYDDVIGAFGGSMERLLAIGGDEELKAADEKEANRFKPVVKYLGPFYLKGGKTGKHTITMPQYIGSVKTMVIAAGNGAYGSAEKVTPVKQPLMILATLPRVAGPAEKIKLPVNVFALDNSVKNVTLNVQTEGVLKVVGTNSSQVKFTGEGDQVVYFDLEANKTGYAKVVVTATAADLKATYDVEMNVIPRNPFVTLVEDKIMEAKSTWQFKYDPLGIEGKNEAAIELSTLPPLNIEKRLAYLIQYPHGCIEQTTSSVFAQLYLGQLTKLTSNQKDEIQNNINAAVNRIKTFQLANGGFSYWPGGSYANLWGTNYAGHFIVEAKNKGYDVPESLMSSWLTFQNQRAGAWDEQNSDGDDDLTQAYRLYTLALANRSNLGAMNRLKEKTSLSIPAKWRLALAYAVAGHEQHATSLIEGLRTMVDESIYSRYWRYSYGSAARDKAMILETLLALDRREDAFSLLKEIADVMGDNNRWMSTQTTAYCFIAIAGYAKTFPLDEEVDVSMSAAGEKVNLKGEEYVVTYPIANPDAASNIELVNNNDAPVFARLVRKGIPLEGKVEPERKNLKMEVKYYTKEGNAINVSKLTQGTNFMVEVTITHPGIKGIYTDMALTQIFPSGWEIINSRLEEYDINAGGIQPTYTDIRDDRVMNYFDLSPNKQIVLKVMLNAAYQGKYYMPSVITEAMYDDDIYALDGGKWVEVVK